MAAILLYGILTLFAVSVVRESERFSSQACINAMNVCVDNMKANFLGAQSEMDALLYNYLAIQKLSSDNSRERYSATLKTAKLMEERLFVSRHMDALVVVNTHNPLHIYRSKDNKYLQDTYAFKTCTDEIIQQRQGEPRSWMCVSVNQTPWFVT